MRDYEYNILAKTLGVTNKLPKKFSKNVLLVEEFYVTSELCNLRQKKLMDRTVDDSCFKYYVTEKGVCEFRKEFKKRSIYVK